MNEQDLEHLDATTLSTKELMELFMVLEAPPLSEMNGEYTGAKLRQSSVFAELAFYSFSHPVWPGRWLGKGFRPVTDTEGRGYNAFQFLGKTVQRFPILTMIAPSKYDGKPACQLIYRAYSSLPGAFHMVDEVRRIRPGIYLGIGTYGFFDGQRRLPNPFLLTGPVVPYRGDIGTRKPSFNPETELQEYIAP